MLHNVRRRKSLLSFLVLIMHAVRLYLCAIHLFSEFIFRNWYAMPGQLCCYWDCAGSKMLAQFTKNLKNLSNSRFLTPKFCTSGKLCLDFAIGCTPLELQICVEQNPNVDAAVSALLMIWQLYVNFIMPRFTKTGQWMSLLAGLYYLSG